MFPNSRRLSGLSASNNQQYRACLFSLPPVFTSRCCKLVSDQFSIFLGRTKSRARKVALPDRMHGRAFNQFLPVLEREIELLPNGLAEAAQHRLQDAGPLPERYRY
jgi:hypothetical protein